MLYIIDIFYLVYIIILAEKPSVLQVYIIVIDTPAVYPRLVLNRGFSKSAVSVKFPKFRSEKYK